MEQTTTSSKLKIKLPRTLKIDERLHDRLRI